MPPKRIHIIGSIGSGKTTLARKLSAQLQIPCFELDNVVWERKEAGDTKRAEEERNEYLEKIIHAQEWIVEGIHHTWVSPSFQKADLILYLDTGITVRRYRIIKRFLMQKIGLEKANYRPTLKILKDLYRYNTVFEHKSRPAIFKMLEPYGSKVIVLKNNSEIESYFDDIEQMIIQR